MSDATADAAVLFCDVCDSVGLYERVGDDRALESIGGLIDAMARTVAVAGGELVRSKGDDVLCTFPAADAALDAACEMLALSAERGVPVHVGIHWGAVTRARGDIFGDAVNVAARLLALANAGELIASEELYERLSADEATRLRRIGRQVIKGKDAPLTLFALLASPAATNRVETLAASRETGSATELPRAVVRLRLGTREFVVRDGESLVIGRSESCGCVVSHPSVSRRHATISSRGGIVTLADSSSTGTWVAIGDAAPIMLRRGSLGLAAEGTIALGARADEPDTPVLHYALEVAWDRG